MCAWSLWTWSPYACFYLGNDKYWSVGLVSCDFGLLHLSIWPRQVKHNKFLKQLPHLLLNMSCQILFVWKTFPLDFDINLYPSNAKNCLKNFWLIALVKSWTYRTFQRLEMTISWNNSRHLQSQFSAPLLLQKLTNMTVQVLCLYTWYTCFVTNHIICRPRLDLIYVWFRWTADWRQGLSAAQLICI